VSKSQWEALLLQQIADADLPEPDTEILFHPKRKWRLDIGWWPYMLCIAVQGAVWGQPVRCHKCGVQVRKRTKAGKWVPVREAGGRHVRGDGFEKDCEKYSQAALLGWRVLPVTPKMIKAGVVVEWVREEMDGRIQKR